MRTIPLLTTLAIVALTAPAQAADTLLAQSSEVTPLSSRGGLLAYSREDERGRWRLVLWENGVGRDAPVRSRERPFDVDLGYGGGRAVAVYSRCEKRRSCDLYKLNVQTGREQRLRRYSRRGSDETSPVVHGSTIVFARGGDAWANRRRIGTALPNGWDLRGNRLLTTTGGFDTRRDRTDVYLRYGRIGRSSRVLAHGASGLLSSAEMLPPTLFGHYAFVALIRRAASGQRFVRIDLRSGARAEARAPRGLQAAVPLRDRVAYVRSDSDVSGSCTHPEDGSGGPCRLYLTPPLSYR